VVGDRGLTGPDQVREVGDARLAVLVRGDQGQQAEPAGFCYPPQAVRELVGLRVGDRRADQCAGRVCDPDLDGIWRDGQPRFDERVPGRVIGQPTAIVTTLTGHHDDEQAEDPLESGPGHEPAREPGPEE
jgi:hypothetical protein